MANDKYKINLKETYKRITSYQTVKLMQND